MSELIHREQDQETQSNEEVSYGNQQEQHFDNVEIVLNQKLEQQEILKKDTNETLQNNSPRLNSLSNPQEQEIPENQSASKDHLKTEENQVQEQEIDLQKTVDLGSQVQQSQEVTFTENQIEKPKSELNNEEEVKDKKDEVKIEDVTTKQNQEGVAQQQKNEEASLGSAKETEPMYTVEKRMSLANQLKDQARDLIKDKRFSEALVLYQQALEITNPTYFRYINEEVKIEYQLLSTQLLNNLAICYFNLGNYQLAAQISDQTLIIDPKNLKAMYRRAVCFKNLGDYERAFEAIKIAVKSGGNESKDIYNEFEAIKKLYKEYLEKNKEREKEVYGRMMNSSKVQEEKKRQQQLEEQAKVDKEYQRLMNSIFFFGSTAVSFLVASKVMKIDVKSTTGFSLAGSFAASVYASYHFGNKWMKGFFGLCAALLCSYMYRKSITQ